MVATLPLENCHPATNPLSIENPNGARMFSTHIGELPLSKLPLDARRAHRVPELASYSLISVPQLCDAGYQVIFSARKADILLADTKEVLYTAYRDDRSRLWMIWTVFSTNRHNSGIQCLWT